ncbi:hypothetical protein [Roseibium aggregatum]|uniref:Uncharacterized protein n=1 Tax=Roseibium aggregatum TaxID=187304 RepID=A0A939EA86_9HYPH|nr:hypothetical protein [Roseibium aggregatum]MBN9669482.1 hypothetical protein [Roseibium aggregatum]
MQAEAGQPLEEIIARKEKERQAGSGLFFWGVGNAPALISKKLARDQVPVQVIFSVMKSKPKREDTSPSEIVRWQNYVDFNGSIRPIPSHTVVTSKGRSASGPKRSHYALMCFSETPLKLRRDGAFFDPHHFRNAGGKGGPVGASQVTALLKQNSEALPTSSAYRIGLSAWLTGSYWVKLVDPINIDDIKLEMAGTTHLAPSCKLSPAPISSRIDYKGAIQRDMFDESMI